jgi:hypothetical protein
MMTPTGCWFKGGGQGRLPVGRRYHLLTLNAANPEGWSFLTGIKLSLRAEQIMLLVDEHVIEVFGAVILGPLNCQSPVAPTLDSTLGLRGRLWSDSAKL